MSLKPSKEEAENAVRTLIAWAGDNPNRKELLETPRRVVEAYQEFFNGYNIDIRTKEYKTFPNDAHYDEMVVLQGINLESHCEHHMVPIIGKATIAYIPNKKIIGLSKIARIIDVFAKRLQIQERLVMEIAQGLDELLEPKGVGVYIESSHQCLTMRGAYKPGSIMQTTHMMGCFKEDKFRNEFFAIVRGVK
jgi:GTP cyclohydrolase I